MRYLQLNVLSVCVVVGSRQVFNVLFQFAAHVLVLPDLPPMGGYVPFMLLDLVVEGQVTSIDVVYYVRSLPYSGRMRFGIRLLCLQLV